MSHSQSQSQIELSDSSVHSGIALSRTMLHCRNPPVAALVDVLSMTMDILVEVPNFVASDSL